MIVYPVCSFRRALFLLERKGQAEKEAFRLIAIEASEPPF